MTVLFVHSCNILGWFAITLEAYDDDVTSSNASFRRYSQTRKDSLNSYECFYLLTEFY